MEWTTEQLNNRVKTYNRIYFNNEIKQPIIVKWSKQFYNLDKVELATQSNENDIHVIKLNVKLQSVSEELMRSILVHEMIHAWQIEHDPNLMDDFENVMGHGPAFIKKCEELNNKFKFTYPLTRFAVDNTSKQIKKQSTGLYFVYKYDSYLDDDTQQTVQYPLGVFVKFLYDTEVAHLKRNGLQIKYYKQPVFSQKTTLAGYAGKPVETSQLVVTYAFIKNATAVDLIQYCYEHNKRMYIFCDEDFNWSDGVDVT